MELLHTVATNTYTVLGIYRNKINYELHPGACETHFDVSENIIEYLVFWYSKGWVIVIGVGAGMDDAIHVKVKVIKLWYLYKQAPSCKIC